MGSVAIGGRRPALRILLERPAQHRCGGIILGAAGRRRGQTGDCLPACARSGACRPYSGRMTTTIATCS